MSRFRRETVHVEVCLTVCLTSARIQVGAYSGGREHEWHLVVPNLFRHFTFQHPARLHHLVELDWRAFSLARLESVRSISDAMKCDSVEQLLVEGSPERRATASLKVNQRLKCGQCLQRPLKLIVRGSTL